MGPFVWHEEGRASQLVRLIPLEYFCDVSTVADIVAVVEKLPEAQKDELLGRLLELKSFSAAKQSKPYPIQPLPLGILSDQLPSHLLEQFEEEELIHKYRGGK